MNICFVAKGLARFLPNSFSRKQPFLCYAIVFLGRQSGLRAGFRPDSSKGDIKIRPPDGLRPAGEPILKLSQVESGRKPARKPDFRLGSTIA